MSDKVDDGGPVKLSDAQIAEIKWRVEKAKLRQDVADSGLLAVIMASDIPALLSDREALTQRVNELEGLLSEATDEIEAQGGYISVVAKFRKAMENQS